MPTLVLYDQFSVPDVVDLALDVSAATKTAAIWWTPAPVRVLTYFNGTYFTSDGLEFCSAPSINDRVLSDVAFKWLNGAGTSRLKFHDATGRSFRGCRVTVDTSVAAVTLPAFEHSPDGSSWTPITATLVQTIVNGDLTTYVYEWADVGSSPPHWSLKRPSGTSATAFTEAMFLEYGSPFLDVLEVRVYDVASGSRSLLARVLSANQPTSSARLSVKPAMTWSETATQDAGVVSLVVVVVNGAGRESEGVTISGSDSAAVAARYVTSIGSAAGVIAAETIAAMPMLGGRELVGPTTLLSADLSAVATSISVVSNVFANGDRIVLQKVVAGVQQTEYMAITSAASGTGPYTYSVTRNLDASGANAWTANDPVVGLGQTGSAFIESYSARGLKSAAEVGPAIVGNIRNSATFDDWTPRWVVGNLNGKFGYATDVFGLAAGVPAGPWIKADPTNGIRIGHNATTKISINASGDAAFTGAITAQSGTIGGWTIGANSLSSGDVLIGGTDGVIAVGSSHAYNNVNCPFYVDGDGLFSLAQNLTWDGTDLIVKAGNIVFDDSGIRAPGGSGALTIGFGGYAMYFDATAASVHVNTVFECKDIYVYDGFSSYQKVIGARGAAVASVASANATDLASVITLANELKSVQNTWLSRARTHGMIAT